MYHSIFNLQVSKFLDVSAAKLNLRRYSDVLLDILFAGGQLGLYFACRSFPEHGSY